MAPHGNRRVGVLKAEPTVAKNRMSRGRLSDCSGSTIGKMEVRVLTHSQAVGSACERRESIACARGLSTPSALSRRAGSGKNALALAASSTSSLVAVRTETVHGLRNDRGMPVFTPGSNPRRLPAAACRRGSWFLSSSRRDGSRRRRGAARRRGHVPTRFLCFCRFRDVRSASARGRRRKGGDGQTRAEPFATLKKNAALLCDEAKKHVARAREPGSRRVRRGQNRNESQAA